MSREADGRGNREVENRREAQSETAGREEGLGQEWVGGGQGGKSLSTFHLPLSTRAGRSHRAFSLIEMIGVMAVMGIMAAVVVPPLITQLHDSQVVSEDKSLGVIAEAILAKARKTGTLPDPDVSAFATNGWVPFAQEYYPYDTNRLAEVFERTPSSIRRLYYDNDLKAFNGINFGAPSSPGPVKGRMFLVSSSRKDLVLSCPTNGGSNASPTLVADLAAWIKQTNERGFYEVPGSVAQWKPITNIVVSNGILLTNVDYIRGEFLHVKVVDFGNFRIGRDLEQEDKNLEEISRALLQGIKTEGRFPNPNANPTAADGWATLAARYSSLGSNAVLRVYPNNTNDTIRRFYLDPVFLSALDTTNLSTPPSGWTNTNIIHSPLMYLVSSSRPDFLLVGPTNANETSATLSWLRNWTKTNVGGLVAATNLAVVSTNWTNRGEHLHVRVVNLREFICRVSLVDRHSPVSLGDPGNPAVGSYRPTTNRILTNGFEIFISDPTAAGWKGSAAIVSQPSENSLSVFSNKVSKVDYRELQIPINATNPAGNSQIYNLGVVAPDSPFFSIHSTTTNQLTYFGNPAVASELRKDSTNFYVIYATPLRLFDNTSSTNLQINLSVTGDVYYRFLRGSWAKE